MNIMEINEEFGTIMYSAFDYKYNKIYVVVYGLQTTQHASIAEAMKDLHKCKQHYLASEGVYDE